MIKEVQGLGRDGIVKIGDYVSLRFSKYQSFFSAEGILVEDLFVSQDLTFFEEHVFQIYVQRQYSATNEFEDFIKNNGEETISQDFSVSSHMEALVRGKDNETALNKTLMRNKSGNKVCFGDTIQLLHVKSNKFVTVEPSDLARDERENMKVRLTQDGSVLSWLKILPRYKIDREGEPLTNGTEVLLKVSERANEYLHCAERPPPKGKNREVNSSLDSPTGWKVSIYQSADELAATSLLLTGQLVYIRDPESQSMLAPLAKRLSLDLNQSSTSTTVVNGTLSPNEAIFFESPWNTSQKFAVVQGTDDEESGDVDDDISLSSLDEYIRDHGYVAFRAMREDMINSDALWVMESKSITKGGLLKLKTDRVHFRHLNTGLYLSLTQPKGGMDHFVLTLDNKPSEKRTLFSLHELHSSGDILRNAKAVQVRHPYYGTYFERGSYNDNQKVYVASATRMKSRAVNVIINRYVQKEKVLVKNISATGDEALDIYFSKAAFFHLARFAKALSFPLIVSQEASTIFPRIDKQETALFTRIMARITLFVRGYPIRTKMNAEELTKFKAGKHIILRRQNMLREVGILQLVMIMIRSLQPLSNLLAQDMSSLRLAKSGFIEMGKEVLSDCLQLLYNMVKKNAGNQLYIADFLIVILEHVSSDKLAARIAQELLSSNRELQETKIGKREVTVFTQKVQETPMNAMYLQLLRTCCSCAGQGLPKNQETVNVVLFQNSPETLISVVINNTATVSVDWSTGSKAHDVFLSPFISTGLVRGKQLYQEGIPIINITWSNKSLRYAPLKLFEKEVVLISDLYSFLPSNIRGNIGSVGNAGFSKSALKKVVGDYLVAQIQLAAEMCLGRNYPIFQCMENLYSYELLVSILRLQVNDELSAAVAYLLQCLYVDREPQSEMPLPRLTRTLSGIVNGNNNHELVSVERSRVPLFALPQLIISNHLHQLKGLPLAAHTASMVQLLHCLVKFSFYGDINKMKDTIEVLMKCLRRGDFDLDEGIDHHGISQSVKKLTAQSRSVSRRSTSRATTPNKSASVLSSDASQINALSRDASNRSMLNASQGLVSVDERLGGFNRYCAVILQALESVQSNCIMIAFLLATIGVSAFLSFSEIDRKFELAFEYTVFAVFLAELLAHYITYSVVNRCVCGFFLNIFHILDSISVILYLVAFINVGSLALYANIGRVTRFATLLRLLATVKAATDKADAAKKDNTSWIIPERYVKTSESTLETLVQMVHVLYTIQTNIEDWRLSIGLAKFSQWSLDSKSGKDDVMHLVSNVMSLSSELSVVHDDDGDDILIDLIMYHHPALVQAALELLMAHHSSVRIFKDNLCKVQLITSDEGEAKYKKLEIMIESLKRDADTHEIWGKLNSPDHRRISNEMHKNLTDLAQECRKVRTVLCFDEKYEPVPFIQNILRNLGCFAVCIKIAQLVLLIDKDDLLKECNLNTRNLSMTANHLLYWFALDNPSNQALAYAELKFFIKTIDHKIDSHKVIKAIFRNNIDLMESVPKKYIEEFIYMICNIGRFPQYLSLMSSIISMGDKNVIGNQYAVIKLMTAPDNQKKILQFFVPTSHPDYSKKIRLMSHYMSAVDVTVDDLPSDLAYHLDLMGLLSCCTIGKSGMTSIEAKVQSMFNFVDIVEAMLDPQCLLLGKIRLGLFLYNGMLDVETPIPALKDADCIWRAIIAAQDVFTFAKDDLRSIEKNGWEAPTSCRQRVEYMLVNAMIIESYFASYFDYTIFKPENGQVAPGVERIQLKETQGNLIIRSLFTKISAIYELMSPLLTREHHEILFNVLVALNDSVKDKMVVQVENIHDNLLLAAQEYAEDENKAPGKTFEEFLQCINDSSEINELVDNQVKSFIVKIERLPMKDTQGVVGTDVRFEALIERLVFHVRGCIQIVLYGEDTIKFIEPSATKTCIWVLRIFRTMIENRWGMSIYERDDDGGEEQDEAVAELMLIYNSSQVTEMCLDLIAKGIDIALQAEALKLLVAMLFKEGGAINIQTSIHNHLSQPGSDMFFRTVRQILHNLMSWHKWNGIIKLGEDANPELPDELILVRCLQLMCEGHYGNNQDIMREQPNNNSSINLLDDFVLYLQVLDSIRCRTSTTASLSLAATILEVIQGPCEGNQEYFALNTELIETLNRVIRQHPVNDCDENQELELKKSAIDIFQALLEGQARKTAVYERMLSVIHVDVILVLCKGNDNKMLTEENEESEEVGQLRTESLVLMQMLTDFRPSLKKELDLDDDMSKLSGNSVACIEIVWRGELQRRFFNIPDICSALAKSTKDNFILTVKRASPEDKLYGLLEASKEMYREILHQQLLKRYHIDRIFCRTNQDSTIWANLYIVIIINLLFILFYTTKDVSCERNDDNVLLYTSYYGENLFCSEVYINNSIVIEVIRALNIALICGAFFTLLTSLLVRAPVNYQAFRERDLGMLASLLYTGLDFSTLYYSAYLGMSVMGIFYHPLLSFLLLDFITMSPTSQGVLQAVFKPRRQILMTLILTFIIMYIFAVYSFFFFSGPENYGDDNAMSTLGNAFRYTMRWMLPFFSGVNYMEPTIDSLRIIDDIMFFVTCVVMLNILKGITIDTFVELRKALEARMEDTTERCFICNIEKNNFNRTLDRNAFRNHVKYDQNLWNYLYFIIYIWEQDKDDDDGLESFVRKCIAENDLTWLPMNKAIRLTEFQERGDVHSLKYRFRKDLQRLEGYIGSRMQDFRDQVNRTLTRVEKSLEYEHEHDLKRGASRNTRSSAMISRGSFGQAPETAINPLLSARSNGSLSANGSVVGRQSTSRQSLLNTEEVVAEPTIAWPSSNSRPSTTPASSQAKRLKLMNLGTSFSSFSGIQEERGALSGTALDADIKGQLHVRIISIAGMLLDPSYLHCICIDVISAKHRGTVHPITEVQRVDEKETSVGESHSPATPYNSKQLKQVAVSLNRTRSSFLMDRNMLEETQNKARQIATEEAVPEEELGIEDVEIDDAKLIKTFSFTFGAEKGLEGGATISPVQLNFNIVDNPPILVHQGSLPRTDLSKFMVKIQISFKGKEGELGAMLGVLRIPFIELLAKAHAGQMLEVLFDQRSVEVHLPFREGQLVDVEEGKGRVCMPQKRGCIVSISVIASHKLLNDFSLVQ